MTPDPVRRTPRVRRAAVILGIAVAALAAVLVLPSLTESAAETNEPDGADRATSTQDTADPEPTDGAPAEAPSTEPTAEPVPPEQALQDQLAGLTADEQLAWRLFVASPEERQAWADFVAPTTTTAPPAPAPAPAPATSNGSVWDQLAYCESGGNWAHSGGSYHGGLQFHPGTWRSYGGTQYATYAYQASREAQIAVAERVLADVGWGAWPACSRRLGLR